MSTFKNGLKGFAFHGGESQMGAVLKNMNDAFAHKAGSMVAGTIQKPEDVARFYLMSAFESQDQPLSGFAQPTLPDTSILDFESFRTEDAPFTEHKLVSFRQKVNNISVYGANVHVELDKELNLVSINSSLAGDIRVSTIAKVSPDEARKRAADFIHNEIPESVLPMLYLYYFEDHWKLVYIIKNVVSRNGHGEEPHDQAPGKKFHQHGLVNYVNVIVDAQTGEVLKESPRTMSATPDPVPDEYIKPKGVPLRLVNEEYNVYTYDLDYKSYDGLGNLPGKIVEINANKWLSAGVHAHVNGCIVARFLKDVLRRNGIDNKGMKLVSSVQCVEQDGKKEWFNAAWLSGSKQMVYGQIRHNGDYRSLATSLDVVGHEILHGVTNATANLDYENQPGALNESYSDIFGIIISNFNSADQAIKADEPLSWNWQLGEEASGVPFRDMSDPARYDQPAHMDDYQYLPNNRWNDWGGVHINSGIHNKAAYNLLITLIPGTNRYAVPARDVAVLYYLALMQLSNVSGFSDSRRAMLNAAKSLYRTDAERAPKVAAIEAAFDAVGID